MRTLVAIALLQATGLVAAATAPELDLLERAANLDTPALLLVFIALLYRGKLVWKREVEVERAEKEAWREAALNRAAEKERHASIAEAALRRGAHLS